MSPFKHVNMPALKGDRMERRKREKNSRIARDAWTLFMGNNK
jgi:hypothetical protein